MSGLSWIKKGLIYVPNGKLQWARSHAQIPTYAGREGAALRILFSSRNADNQSLIGRIDVDSACLSNVVQEFHQPLMQLGQRGTFDDAGMMPSCVVELNGVHYLYYIGWNTRGSVPYHNSVGLAISDDGGRKYRRLFEGPVMDRTAQEPYFCATTFVHIENGIWRNWYLSCTGWYRVGDKTEPRYHLKYAESRDGIHWTRNAQVAVDYINDLEGGIVRASVVQRKGRWHMWYSFRDIDQYRTRSSASYRIGYAQSDDGYSWRRMDDQAGIDKSESGWDSFMLAYPNVFEIDERTVMLYNGNGFGQSGFGYAEAVPIE